MHKLTVDLTSVFCINESRKWRCEMTRQGHLSVARMYEKEAEDLIRQYSGVRPGWVSTDITLALYRRDMHLQDAELADEKETAS